MSGIRFTDEFKRDAVAQVVDRGYSVAEVSDRLESVPSHFIRAEPSSRSRANKSTRPQSRPQRSGG